jgi:Nucleotidyltransferase of unknown function (DUF6036)
MGIEIRQPWRSFLRELDGLLTTDVCLHCLGGFVVTACYGLPRVTADLDVLIVLPSDTQTHVAKLAGRGSDVHRKHGVYLDVVTVATCPDDYEARLTEVFPGECQHLRLLALDPYDLALAKLERNLQRDRDDVMYLADIVPFDLKVLRERYRNEMRLYLGRPEREDLTLDLWIEMIEERRRDDQR